MRKSFLLPAVLTLFLLVPASITWAQTISTQKGLTTAVFQTPNGTIKVYLPDDIRAGDMISGTVTAIPEGNNERQLQRNLAELSRFGVLFNGQMISLNPQGNQTRFTSSVRAVAGCNLGIAPAGSAVPVQQLTIPPVSPALQKKTPAQCIIPGHVLEGSPMTVPGPFDGNAANTQCAVGNQPATILAESPRSCTVQFPANANGMQHTQISESGQAPCTKNVSAVQLNVTAGKLNLRSGEKTFIKVDITGLQDLPDTALLSLINMSTGVVNLLPSNTILIPLLPGEVASGNFSRQFDVQSTRTGNFTVNVNLDLPDVWLSPGPDDTGNENPDNKKGEKTEGQEEATGETVESGHTQEKQPGSHCECDGSCSVLLTGESDKSFTYQGTVKAVCKGVSGTGDTRVVCEVGKIVYKWHMSDKSKEVVEFDGPTDQKTVQLKKKAPGSFTLNLTVTITCSDGTACERNCNAEGTIPPPLPNPGKCIFSWAELPDPVMDGRLKTAFNKTYTIRRDEFIPLGAEGSDDDRLVWNCLPLPECKITGGSKQEPLNGRVRFEWRIVKGGGSFSQLGCFPDEALTAAGDYVIFKPPVVPLPVKNKDTSFTTKIKLFIIDDNPTQIQDETVVREILITTVRKKVDRSINEMIKPDFIKGNNIADDLYEITVKSSQKYTPTEAVRPSFPDAVCKPDGPNWDKEPPMPATAINLPDIAGNDVLLTGQWVALTATDVRDVDIAKKIGCVSAATCPPTPPLVKKYEDNVKFNWKLEPVPGSKVSGNYGKFANELTIDAGAVVIYKVPDTWPDKVKGDYFEVRISLYASNPSTGERKDVNTPVATKDLKVYKPGVKLDMIPKDWLPEAGKSIPVTSRLVYQKGEKWVEAPAHACRIHFFELLNVSAEKGICGNAPVLKEAKTCRDLLFKRGGEMEVHTDTSFQESCNGQGYFMQARSQAPVHEATILVHCEDYGASGFIRSFANINRGGATGAAGEKPFYESVTVKKADVSHPYEPPKGEKKKEKRTEYPDNRINLPTDIDENFIPDNGWIVTGRDKKTGETGTYLVPDFTTDIRMDTDNEPVGDGWYGDGLSLFEEYRGFMQEGDKHIRTNPSVKDLFVYNKNDLPVKEFIRITGIDYHPITGSQYDAIPAADYDRVKKYYKNNYRFINFNYGRAHVVHQKGLFLLVGPIALDGVVGITPSETDEKNDEPIPAPPNYNVEVRVDRDKIRGKFKEKEEDAAYERKLQQVTAHELCHALNVYHHGEKKDNPGLTSGNKECIMRYDNYGTSNEVPGNSLCIKVDGANEGKHRGKCALQIRVSGRLEPNQTEGYPKR